MRTRMILTAFLFIAAAFAIAANDGTQGTPEYTSDFGLERCEPIAGGGGNPFFPIQPSFLPNGNNPYFPLTPGRVLWLEGQDQDDDEFIELKFTVTNQTKPIFFTVKGKQMLAITRVIEEREWINGELVEISRNYFARCANSENVYYFGEDVDFFEDGEIVGHDGSWLAGQDGAKPGLIMPDPPLAGARYFQEVAPGIALDRARHVKTTATLNTPAGTFKNCLKVIETTPLEPGSESIKVYAPGIGLIQDDDIKLVEYHD